MESQYSTNSDCGIVSTNTMASTECESLTSITILLKLYNSHRMLCYVNYFEAFKLLVDFLDLPIRADEVEYLVRGLPSTYIPWYLRTYEVQELSTILAVPQELLIKLLLELPNERH